jgi:hypothetical protein
VPLITVWLEVRVLPGPPIIAVSCVVYTRLFTFNSRQSLANRFAEGVGPVQRTTSGSWDRLPWLTPRPGSIPGSGQPPARPGGQLLAVASSPAASCRTRANYQAKRFGDLFEANGYALIPIAFNWSKWNNRFDKRCHLVDCLYNRNQSAMFAFDILNDRTGNREAPVARTRRPIAKQAAGASRNSPNKTYRILVDISPDETRRNLGAFHIDHCCMPQPEPDAAGVRRLHAYASGVTVAALRKSGRKVKVLADADVEAKRLQNFIGKGDRYKGGRRGPPGVGKLI